MNKSDLAVDFTRAYYLSNIKLEILHKFIYSDNLHVII